jgi:hypothetical protein
MGGRVVGRRTLAMGYRDGWDSLERMDRGNNLHQENSNFLNGLTRLSEVKNSFKSS